jgi:signal transduction histidine kinase
LIFKEALNNIARHAHCATVALNISVTRRRLLAELRDDGRGLAGDPQHEGSVNGRGGNGLGNMQARAAELGGALEIASTPGRGTRLTLTIPLPNQYVPSVIRRLRKSNTRDE